MPDVDEGVFGRITGVLGEVDAGMAASDGDERGESRLEAMLPLLQEAELAVPLDGSRRVGDSQDRDHLVWHDATVPGATSAVSCEAVPMTATISTFSPLLGGSDADDMLRLCRDFGGDRGYGMYSNEGFDTGYAPKHAQRIDTIFNYLADNADSSFDLRTLAARTNYFRETYAYGAEITAPGVEAFYRHGGLIEAAAGLFDDRPVVEPAIVYANILVPGQVLTVHTDVPEFRGASRKTTPQWLLVVMHHSGLFDEWRMPIATAISYFGDDEGGSLRYYPDGHDAPPQHFATAHDTGILLDTDSVFHAVELVEGPGEDDVSKLAPGMRLVADGDDDWVVRPDGETDADDAVVRYHDRDIRFSVSWKAYCFTDESERDAWRVQGDIPLEAILQPLEVDLRERGVLTDERPEEHDFAQLLIDTYIAFPPTFRG